MWSALENLVYISSFGSAILLADAKPDRREAYVDGDGGGAKPGGEA